MDNGAAGTRDAPASGTQDQTAVGVDGAPGGWAVATVTAGGIVAFTLAVTFADVLAAAPRESVIGVDMPIGLPTRGRRDCDLLAKRTLGRAHARVFLTPPRAVLEPGSHPEASALHRTLVDGAGLSIQTWHLLRKVAEVDGLADDPRVVEVHPELSFALLAGLVDGDALVTKHRPEGRAARLAAVRRWLPDLAPADVPRGEDHLDALAAAWSAQRWAVGTATVLPDDPPRDERGRPMRIVT